MKKLLAILLCVCMIAALAGCSNSAEKDAPAATEAPKATEAPAATEAPKATEAPVATEAPKATEAPAATEAPVATEAPAAAEELPAAPVVHYTFDGDDAGIVPVIQAAKPDELTADADYSGTYVVVPSETYTDKEGNEKPTQLLYADGPVNKCLYINGAFGVKLDQFKNVSDDTYTISFWINADRLSTYGPTVQLGHNMARESKVAWINFTQTEWGTNSAKIFPVVWNRNIDDNGAWPWFYATDDSIHGKREWVLVTLVADGQIYQYTDGLTAYDLVNTTMYLDGQQVFYSDMSAYGGMATGILSPEYENELLIGINYWDTIFKGYIDDLYIFDEALTPGQVLTLFQMGNKDVETVAPEEPVVEEPAEYAGRTDVVADPAAIATVGTIDCNCGWWSQFSNGYEIADGQTVTVNFKNHGSGVNNWENYVVGFANMETKSDLIPSADNYAGYAEYGVFRSDAYGWGFTADAVYTSTWDWANFPQIMYDADVTLAITRTGSDISVAGVVKAADGTSYDYTVQATTTATAADPMYFFFVCEKAYLEIMSVQ